MTKDNQTVQNAHNDLAKAIETLARMEAAYETAEAAHKLALETQRKIISEALTGQKDGADVENASTTVVKAASDLNLARLMKQEASANRASAQATVDAAVRMDRIRQLEQAASDLYKHSLKIDEVASHLSALLAESVEKETAVSAVVRLTEAYRSPSETTKVHAAARKTLEAYLSLAGTIHSQSGAIPAKTLTGTSDSVLRRLQEYRSHIGPDFSVENVVTNEA